jgi:Cu+-exporting ATPase
MGPWQKAQFVKELQERGFRVAMVGDGINDAPALSQSDLGIAAHAGGHLGREVADITLMRGTPEQVLDFLHLARRVNRKVLQNLMFSFAYNLVAIPVAMIGVLTPIVAVSAMLLSSLSVTGNTLLLLRKTR